MANLSQVYTASSFELAGQLTKFALNFAIALILLQRLISLCERYMIKVSSSCRD